MNNSTLSTPINDGFFMPAEFEPHDGCIIVWPERSGSWIYKASAAREAFRNVINAISKSETVYVAASKTSIDSAKKILSDLKNVNIFEATTDDAWARDIAPTFIVNSKKITDNAFNKKENITGSNKQRQVRCINWEFNAWGGKVDGLYSDWKNDNAFAKYFAKKYGYDIYDATPFVMEGGAIHSDGEGTVLVTEACLLSEGRNPKLSKIDIEQKLHTYLGCDKVIWLPRGIYNDETNEHIDNICAFIRPSEVVLAWTDNKDDPQYALSMTCLQKLESETDAKGRKITVHKLPIPDIPICITEYELNGYEFEEGEDTREVGERLAASYVNFYFSNESIILPAFGGENTESDKRAIEIMQKLCPDREVIPIYAKDILVGGGNIHCITQQIPKI